MSQCSHVAIVRHSRVGGNPVITRTPLDSRLRGNDLLAFLAAWEPLVGVAHRRGHPKNAVFL